MQNQRVKFRFILSGAVANLNDIVNMLGAEITQIYGGVTISSGTGFWISDGNETKTLYTGKLFDEEAIIIDLTILPEDEKSLLPNITRIFKNIKKQFDTPWKDVHTERSMVEALHFDLDKDASTST